MGTSKVDKLLGRAHRAFENKKFALAEKYWTHALSLQPDDARIICNLGIAKTELGEFDEALARFTEAIKKDVRCGRAYNNQAALLVRMGADPRAVLPSFIMALELSESYDDFGRHALNVCRTVAYGFDPGKSPVFDEMEKNILAVAARFKPKTPTAAQTLATFWPGVISAHRHAATYRESLAAKRWSDADLSLETACQTFGAIGLEAFAKDLRVHRKIFDLAKAIYAFLEEIGSAPNLTLAAAFERGKGLHQQASKLADELEHAAHDRLLHTLGWFLTLLTNQLARLAGAIAEHPKIEKQIQVLIWLSSGSFRKIGDEFIAILNFVDRRLQAFLAATQTAASELVIERLRSDEWARVALFVNGQILGFADIEATVARSTLRWANDPVDKIRAELQDFRSFVERQAYRDVFVGGKPMENIARTLLQARLSARSYREVPTRAGRSDLLVFIGGAGRVLIETKIWRGADYHEAGIQELAQYVAGEKDDHALLGVFYVVFDPTETQRAAAHEGGLIAVRSVAGVSVEVITVSLRPPTPSRPRATPG